MSINTNPSEERERILSDAALAWADRGIWLACVGVYVAVFVGSLLAGVADLTALGRAIALTLATALVGKFAVGLMSQATQPVQKAVPMTEPTETLGSLVDLMSSPNVSAPQDKAEAA
jgi:hypothetical protein